MNNLLDNNLICNIGDTIYYICGEGIIESKVVDIHISPFRTEYETVIPHHYISNVTYGKLWSLNKEDLMTKAHYDFIEKCQNSSCQLSDEVIDRL